MKTTRIALLVCAALAPLPAAAASITFNFSSGPLSASALFEKSGSNLIVTLTNTSLSDATVPTDILTAVYFQITGDPLLTRISAEVPLTSEVFDIGTGTNVTPLDRVVGGEWSYLNGINPSPPNNSGVSSTGVGIFGPGNLFPGPNLQGPSSPDGVQYGITSAGDNVLTGNGGISGSHLIKNAVRFTLGGWSGEPSEKITAATFQYGTSLDEPQFPGLVPEPSSMALLGCGAAGLAIYALRRRTARPRSQSR